MIVCICQSISDREIRAAICNGATSFEQLQLELGVATCCGKCADAVCNTLAQAQSSFKAPLIRCRNYSEIAQRKASQANAGPTLGTRQTQ